MGKLIRNGIEYGGGNGTDIFEVTQAQYNALKTAGTLVRDALYVITDAPNLNATANDLSMGSAPYASGSVGKAITDLQYNKGDTITESTEIVLSGHTNGAGTNAICYLPLSKPIASDVSSVTMQISGAVVYNHSGSTNLTNGTYTATNTKDGLRLSFPISSTLTGSIAVTVAITTRTLTFS